LLAKFDRFAKYADKGEKGDGHNVVEGDKRVRDGDSNEGRGGKQDSIPH